MIRSPSTTTCRAPATYSTSSVPFPSIVTVPGPLRAARTAGACASTLAQDSYGYASGLSLGEASFFGRQAGVHAALHERVA